MQNGIRHLRELKIWYRPDVMYSNYHYGGMKKFVDEWLPDFQARHPDVKITVFDKVDPIRANDHSRNPMMVGYYLNGTSVTFSCSKAAPETINQYAYDLRNTCNDCEPRPNQHTVIDTEMESVQGMWTPYLWMADGPLVEEDKAEVEDRWQQDIRDIARYVRLKKEHREEEFEKRHQKKLIVKRKMEQRWENTVFPYTVGHDTEAVPGRLFLEETRSIFPEAGGHRAPDSAQEIGGGGFMGGFVKPFDRPERSALAGGMVDDKYAVKDQDKGGTVPPFAGAPFTSGYGEYENFWKNWDLFNYTSRRYQAPRSEIMPNTMQKEREDVHRGLAQQSQRQRRSPYPNAEYGSPAGAGPSAKGA